MEIIDRQHLEATLESVARNVRAHYEGSIHSYRVVAASLRTLLCDYSRGTDVSLLPRCYENPRLPATRGRSSANDTLYIPARMHFDGNGGCVMDRLFLENPGQLSLEAWLQQSIMDSATDIKSFIRSVADKEGAHADAIRGNTLDKAHSVMLGSRHTLTSQFIVAIADCVVDYIAMRHIVQGAKASTMAQSCAAVEGRGAIVVDLHDFCMQGLNRHELPYVQMENEETPQLRELMKYEPATAFILGRRSLSGTVVNYTGWALA